MANKCRTSRLTPLAEADLEDIWLYTFRQWSLEQADEYHRGIMTAIESLTSGRNIGQRTDIREGYWTQRSRGSGPKYAKLGNKILYSRNALEIFLDAPPALCKDIFLTSEAGKDDN